MTDFPTYSAFVEETTGHKPYLWQEEMARRLYAGKPPSRVDVEAGMGKSSIVGAWVWAFARQRGLGLDKRTERTVSTRLHFVVDRRVIVDEVVEQAKNILLKLRNAPDGSALAAVQRALCDGRPDSPDRDAFDIIQLRGGLARHPSHTEYPHVPAVVTSTIDMFGSRLLFRGYGVSRYRYPIDAALTGCDTTIVVDEAHLAGQLIKTLDILGNEYPSKGLDGVLRRHVVRMSATLSRDMSSGREEHSDVLRMDREAETAANADLKGRLTRRDGVTVRVRDVGSTEKAFEKALVDEALECADGPNDGRSVCVFVNDPERAIAVKKALSKELEKPGAWEGVAPRIVMLHGRMDDVSRRLAIKALTGAETNARDRSLAPHFVISTQVLEVGADLDFDHIVTAGCSLDAFIQRAGRCNRVGAREEGTVIVVPEPKPSSLYAGTEPKAMEVLRELKTMGEVRAAYTDEKNASAIRSCAPPAIMDRHVFEDYLITSKREWETPVSRWLRDDDANADVDLVWRETGGMPVNVLSEYVKAAPPMRWETISWPVWEARADARLKEMCEGGRVLLVRGGDPSMVGDPEAIRPGDTVILPADDKHLDLMACDPHYTDDEQDESVGRLVLFPGDPFFGHIAGIGEQDGPSVPVVSAEDVADLLRNDESLAEDDARRKMLADPLALLAKFPAPDDKADGLDREIKASRWGLARRFLRALAPGSPERAYFNVISEPDTDEPACVVITLRKAPAEAGTLRRSRPSLSSHNSAVAERARLWALEIGLPDPLLDVLKEAGLHHDDGKRAPYFQDVLRWNPDTGSFDAEDVLVAKSLGHQFATKIDKDKYDRESSEKAGKPYGFRHEAMSVALRDAAKEGAGEHEVLIRHLIGTHHGRGRGLFPLARPRRGVPLKQVVAADGAHVDGLPLQDPSDQRWARWASQFKGLNELIGPYKLAFLETVLRLADWECSREDLGEETQQGDEQVDDNV